MRPHVCLLLALAALHARAASIPAPAETNFEKKLTEAVKEVLEKDAELQNVSSEQELIDQQNFVKDIDNKLLKQVAVDSIPVKVVVEKVEPSLKASDEKKDCDKVVDEEDFEPDVKRAEVDLKHPGEPQRQEHETQNPEHYENEHDAVVTIKQLIKNTQDVFNEGLTDIRKGVDDWLRSPSQDNSIKSSIDHLQESFMEQVSKLKDTIHSYVQPDATDEETKKASIKNVESGLKVVEDNFESGVESLNNGVQVLSLLQQGPEFMKSEIRDDASSATEKPSSNPFGPFFQSFQSAVQHSFGNFTNVVQNFFANQGNNSTVSEPGAQSDEKPSNSRPSVWQGIQSSIQGILNPSQQPNGGQQSDEQAPSGPFAQVIQNNPFVQGVISFIQPKPQAQAAQPAPAKPEKPSEPAPNTESEGSNIVPSSDEKPAADQQKDKPEKEGQPAPAAPQAGPIQQIIQRNPIVQGITGVVQRVQQSITNPEKPREEPVEKNEKAGFWYGHGGHRPGEVTAWSTFVNGLIGTIGATINGTANTVSNAVNSAINTLGTNIQVPRGTALFDFEHNNDVDGGGLVNSAPAEEEKEKAPEEVKEKVDENISAEEQSEKEPSPEAPVKQD